MSCYSIIYMYVVHGIRIRHIQSEIKDRVNDEQITIITLTNTTNISTPSDSQKNFYKTFTHSNEAVLDSAREATSYLPCIYFGRFSVTFIHDYKIYCKFGTLFSQRTRGQHM